MLDGLLGPAGFDVAEDILAITVNRWPHGYSYGYLDLWDPDWEDGQAPHEIARRPIGNISDGQRRRCCISIYSGSY